MSTCISRSIQRRERQRSLPKQQLGGCAVPEGRLIPCSMAPRIARLSDCVADLLGRPHTRLSHTRPHVATRNTEILLRWSPAKPYFVVPDRRRQDFFPPPRRYGLTPSEREEEAVGWAYSLPGVYSPPHQLPPHMIFPHAREGHAFIGKKRRKRIPNFGQGVYGGREGTFLGAGGSWEWHSPRQTGGDTPGLLEGGAMWDSHRGVSAGGCQKGGPPPVHWC